MARKPAFDQVLRLLARALNAGAVVELAGRALVRVETAGRVMPSDRTGAWPAFAASEPGLYACCPLLTALPTAALGPGCYGWLRLGETDEVEELLPVAEWLAALGPNGVHAFTVGLLHGLGRIVEASSPADGARPLIRTPESLARELFG